MARTVTVAVTQMACGWDVAENLATAETRVREAAAAGANVILLQELFERCYFCQHQAYESLDFATPLADNPAVNHFRPIARELGVVLPISYYEQANNALYNSIAILDADGQLLGNYRKSHIPDGPGYSEKFYFTPGDSGFRVWDTRFGRIGVAICWDQWFPESARAMALMGAELLLYPTAIGSEPHDPMLDSSRHWHNTQQGHAAANMVPLVASNRVGREVIGGTHIDFYGQSFIADQTGERVVTLDDQPGHGLATFDLDDIARQRRAWGLFRDRRPELYGALLTKDGGVA